MAKQAKPVFLLKGINIKSVLDNYLNDVYDDLELPSKKNNVVIKQLDRTQNSVANNTKLDSTYELNDRGNLIRVYTTNSQLFNNYNNKFKSDTHPVRCLYCRRVIDESFSLAVITSISYRGDYIICNGYDGVCSIKDGGLQCAMTHLMNEVRISPKNVILTNAITNLNNIAFMYTGEHRIATLPDWRLLDSNGGSMTDKEFFNSKPLTKINNIVFNPGKVQYSE